MSWFKTIKRFLSLEASPIIHVGERNSAWIESFQNDLVRWDLPVDLILGHEIGAGDKFSVAIVKREEGAGDE